MDVVSDELGRVVSLLFAKLALNAKIILMRIAFRHFKPNTISFLLTFFVCRKGFQYRNTVDSRQRCKQDD